MARLARLALEKLSQGCIGEMLGVDASRVGDLFDPRRHDVSWSLRDLHALATTVVELGGKQRTPAREHVITLLKMVITNIEEATEPYVDQEPRTHLPPRTHLTRFMSALGNVADEYEEALRGDEEITEDEKPAVIEALLKLRSRVDQALRDLGWAP